MNRMRHLVACVLALVLAHACRGPDPSAASKEGIEGPFKVARVVDGDTIHVSHPLGGRKVRLVCIDTPEVSGHRKSPLGKEATAALRKLLKRKKVYLKPAEDHDDMDRHSRLLRHVFLEDDTHINLEVVRRGWSAYYTKYGPCPSYHVRFLDAEDQARASSAGIWAHPDFLDGGYLDNARGRGGKM